MFLKKKDFWFAGKLALLVIAFLGYLLIFRNMFEDNRGDLQNTVLFPISLGSEFKFEENGEYWIIHNYIQGKKTYENNQSITIISWMAIDHLLSLKELLKRWDGPISTAIYVSGTDYGEFLQAFQYLLKCTNIAKQVDDLVTVNLVFHYEHIPVDLKPFKKYILIGKDYQVCRNIPWALQTNKPGMPYWQSRSLLIPENVLRNVARQHANTYFVMSLEPNYYPLKDGVSRFLNLLTANTTTVLKPFKSIYCFAVLRFSAPPSYLPSSNKGALLYLKHLTNNLSDKNENLQLKQTWFRKTIKFLDSEMSINSFHDKSSHCSLVNIFVNQYRPPFDERFPYDNRELRLLEELGYHFVTIKGFFVIGSRQKSYSSRVIHKLPKIVKKVNFPLYGDQWKTLYL